MHFFLYCGSRRMFLTFAIIDKQIDLENNIIEQSVMQILVYKMSGNIRLNFAMPNMTLKKKKYFLIISSYYQTIENVSLNCM